MLGLKRLGCEVYLIEQISEDHCHDEYGNRSCFESSANLKWFRKIVNDFGLVDRAALLCEDYGECEGIPMARVIDIAREADLLLNVSGNLTHGRLRRLFRRSAYLDLDPGFTQLWHASGSAGPRFAGHDSYLTIGENLGTPHCGLPTGGLQWRPTRQPVVLDDWPVVAGDPDLMTTVAAWRGPFGPVQHDGRQYGVKAHEFRRFAALPGYARQMFEIALDIHPADHKDRRRLEDLGWRISDPQLVAADPHAFRDFVRRSGAEFSAVQGMYAATNSGWFSDRSVRYLASGKPVLVQDTGFGQNLPTGQGLLAFKTLEEAVAGAASIWDRYAEHAAAARRIAESHFDSDHVLPKLLEEVGVAA